MKNSQWLNLSNFEAQENDVNNLTLMEKLVSDKSINFTVINVLTTSWNIGPNLHINALDRNTIACTFTFVEDRDKIMKIGPWAVKTVILNLKKWPLQLHLQEINSNFCPF